MIEKTFLQSTINNRQSTILLGDRRGDSVSEANIFKSQRLPSLSLTDVYLPPEECGAPFGARVICDQIHTVHKSMVIEYRYRLSERTMREIDQRLLLGIGLVKIEELERA